MSKLDTLLFDLDGTLIDSNRLIIESFRHTLLKFDPNKNYSDEMIIEMIGPPLFETFQAVTKDRDVLNKMISTYRKIYIELEFSLVNIYPHVIETLKEFKMRGFNIGVVTTKFRASALPSLEYFGISKYLDILIGLDDVTNHKPHPEPIIKALANFEHGLAMMVGDNSSDILAGKNARILTCGVGWSIKKAELETTNPDYWINDFRELINIVDTINEGDE